MKIIKPLCEGIMVNAEEETRYLKFIHHLDIVILLVHVYNSLTIRYSKYIIWMREGGRKNDYFSFTTFLSFLNLSNPDLKDVLG